MEKMPFRDSEAVMDVNAVIHAARATTTEINWRQTLPVLAGTMVTLRELRLSGAPSLLTMLSTDEVARFISPPPTTVDGFEATARCARSARFRRAFCGSPSCATVNISTRHCGRFWTRTGAVRSPYGVPASTDRAFREQTGRKPGGPSSFRPFRFRGGTSGSLRQQTFQATSHFFFTSPGQSQFCEPVCSFGTAVA